MITTYQTFEQSIGSIISQNDFAHLTRVNMPNSSGVSSPISATLFLFVCSTVNDYIFASSLLK